jgi:EmrB/QacA subfamily drug resistance transporter
MNSDIAGTGERVPESVMVSDRRPLVFAAALSTMFMAAIEGTIVATAMPTIVGVLGGFDLFSWVFSAYLLTQAVTIPIYGRLADIYGRKHILLFGIALFLAGSVLCGLAWSMPSLIVFRVIQGLGAGSLVTVSQTIVGDIYTGEQRARMQGYISSTFGSASILGPLIGGLLVNHLSWKTVFWINIPLGIAAAFMLIAALTENVEKRQHRIDYVGAILTAASFGLMMFALVHSQHLSRTALILAFTTCGVLFLLLFIYELQVREPMLPLRLYRNRIIAGGNSIGLTTGAILISIVGFLPAYLQGVMGFSPMVAGVALGAMSASWPFGGFVGSRMLFSISYRMTAAIGSVILVIGSLLMITLHASNGIAQPVAAALLMGFGMGVTNICFVVGIQATVDWSDRGAATSSVTFSRIIGQSFGGAIFGAILNVGLSGLNVDGANVVDSLLGSGGRPDALGVNTQLVIQALTGSLHNIYLLSGLLALAVMATVLTLPSDFKLIDR